MCPPRSAMTRGEASCVILSDRSISGATLKRTSRVRLPPADLALSASARCAPPRRTAFAELQVSSNATAPTCAGLLCRCPAASCSRRTVGKPDSRTARFAVYDFTRPYELVYTSPVELAVFGFPREMLAVSRDSVREIAAVPIAAEHGIGALVVPLLRRVTLDLETYQPASAIRLSAVVMDLLTAAVAERVGRGGSLDSESWERTLVVRVHAFIDEHLGETDLSPGIVAAAHHISLRYLHKLFETEQTTVASWIRHRRLERCRKDLADPAHHSLPVSAVAARWGLPDAAHFSRLFRSTYGVPPVEYRRSCLER